MRVGSFTTGFLLEVIGSVLATAVICSLLWLLSARVARFDLLGAALVYCAVMNVLCLLFSFRTRVYVNSQEPRSALGNALVAVSCAMLSLNVIAIIGALYVLVWVADQARPVRRESVRPLDYESRISISYFPNQEKQIDRNSSPFFEARTIEKAILSDDKVLRDSSGKNIGFLEKAIFSNNQIVRDNEGKKVGLIEENILDKAVWGLNIQTIKDSEGKKIGEISTGFFGDRVITDSRGKKVGTIRKGFLGETVIDHSGEGEDWVSFAINVGIAVMAFIALLTYLLLKSLYIGIKYATQQLNTKIKARKTR